MHELRILRLLHRRVFWKCDFSCELFILPTCVPLLILHLISRRWVRAGPRARTAGLAGDRRLFSSHNGHAVCWTRGSPVAAARARRALTCLCVCRDAAAGRHDADGRDVPERHGHAAALPVAARAAASVAAVTLSVDRRPPAERRPERR